MDIGERVRGKRETLIVDLAEPVALATETAPRPYLTIFCQGSAQVFQLERDGIFVVGRSGEAHLNLNDSAVSRRHLSILLEGKRAVLEDLGSSNGTWINGVRVTTAVPIEAGSIVTLGTTELVFQWPATRQSTRRVLDRTSFEQLLEAEVERSMRHHHPLTLLLVTAPPSALDGGSSLRLVAQLVRRMDCIGRLADDTIAVLLPELVASDALTVCERVLRSLRMASPSSKCGLAHWPDDGYDVSGLLEAARAALEGAAPGTILAAQASALRLQLGAHVGVFADPASLRLVALTKRLAAESFPVLIQGETGVGKDLFATALHQFSSRADGPFVSINCAALPESLAESELFGHARGAFSGANRDRVGRLESAQGGTVFLDEIGDLPLSIQAKLLRVLEDKTVTRIGENHPRPLDIRIVAATNRMLQSQLAQGSFRSDLFFRLSGATLEVPPLRERPRDIPVLVRTLLDELSVGRDRPISVTAGAMGYLVAYPWPGNVRELRNALTYAVTSAAGGDIEDWMLPDSISGCGEPQPTGDSATPEERRFKPIDEEIRELETRRMKEALEACKGNQRRAAALIRMPLRTFQAKCKKYGMGSRSGRVQLVDGTPVAKGTDGGSITTRITVTPNRR